MNSNLAWFLGALLLLGGCGTAGDQSDGDSSTGGPPRTVTVEQARAADVGERLRVHGSLMFSKAGAVMCDALAESYPPQCANGLPLRGFRKASMPAGAESASGMSWVNQTMVVAERTTDGLRYLRG
jgi:hypothetical protein